MVLLKNDGTLPLSKRIRKIALVGPWANATTQMQGNYEGIAPSLVSPLQAFQNAGFEVSFANGTTIAGTDTSGFDEALQAAQGADAIVYAGGIDDSVEAEGHDRDSIAWPGNQLDLVAQLEAIGKPLVVLQMGGGQVDSSSLKASKKVWLVSFEKQTIMTDYHEQVNASSGGDIQGKAEAPPSSISSPARPPPPAAFPPLSTPQPTPTRSR